MSIDAAKAGKDIYCETSVAEGRAMVDASRRVIEQTGNLERSMQLNL